MDPENADISKRAEVVKNWEDFLIKYLSICQKDEFDETNNCNGYVNLGTAVNKLCIDIILSRLTNTNIWKCDPTMLDYRKGYGITKLRKAMANLMNEFLKPHQKISPDDIIVIAGVTACIDLLGHCIADPGDVILAPTPIYSRIKTDLLQRAEVHLWPIPIFTKDSTETFPVLTLEKVKKAYANAISQNYIVRGIFLINPNNPLGDVYSTDLLMDILSFCKEKKLHVIVDELYAQSTYDKGQEFHSLLSFENWPDKMRTHVLYGLSKDFGVAGLRIGAIYTQNKCLMNCLKQLSFFQCISFPMMDITARFLDDLDWCKEYICTYKQRLSEKRVECINRLKEMGLKVRDADGGLFLWVDFRPICGSKSFSQEKDFFSHLFEKARVYIVPGKELLCEQPGWFRVTFSANPKHVDEALKRLEKALKTYKKLDV